jgi:ATP-dependent Clp protease ATP-binding subunit ClpC
MPLSFSPDPSLVAVGRVFPPSARRLVLSVPWGIAILFFFAGLFGDARLVGLAAFAVAVAIAAMLATLFVEHGLELPQLREPLQAALLRARRGETVNIAPFVAAEVLRAIPISAAPSLERALRRLLETERAVPIFARLLLDRREALAALAQVPPLGGEDRFLAALGDAATHAIQMEHERISFADALVAFAKNSVAFKQFLFDRAIEIEDLDAVAQWEDRRRHEWERRRKFWSRENLFAIRPFGRSWAYGYTPTLDRYASDLSARIAVEKDSFRILGRVNEIRSLERALAKMASANALLIGEPGVGVEDVVVGFARRIVEGKSLPTLNYRRVIAADFAAAIAGLTSVGEMEGRVRQMLSEAARAGGTILVIENIHTILSAEIGATPIDLSPIFVPFLAGSRIQVIATTTPKEFHEVIEKRETLLPLFVPIDVREPESGEALHILFDALPLFEARFRVAVPYPTLKALVSYADRTIQDVPFPRKGFEVLEAALITALEEHVKVLRPEHVATVISERTEIPVGALTASERKKLLELETFIHERIVDQDEAVRAIADALRRARSGIVEGATNRPIGTFLFLGPTGVGKTETAKALAEMYFGSEERMIRFDMSEFQSIDAIDRLIGSPALREEGKLTTSVRDHPFSLLLLDEFEKANEKVLDLFLPIFDEGRIKDGWGRRVSFTNTLIIATSNAGAEFIREYLTTHNDISGLRDALREEILRRGILKPELLNRFDGVIVFKPLGVAEVRAVAEKLLARFSQHLLREKGISVEVEPEALERIIAKGFKQEFGARELRRVLQDTVENAVAKKVLAGEVKRGETIRILASEVSELLPSE